MFEITAHNAADYLHSAGRVAAGETIKIRELPGGVSNVVLLVELHECGERFVVKQARGRLRVSQEWLCPVERIWHEVESLRLCREIVGGGSAKSPRAVVPAILWEDHLNYAYAMTAAPAEHTTWKQMLLAGDVESSRPLAMACGRLLARLHAGSWPGKDMADLLYEATYFVQLRIEPYYYHVARLHADLAPAIEQLIESVWENRRCFVHGDFSPKNLLVWPGHVMLIDFEVGHCGDPAFDLGFFLTHLVLKCIWAGERQSEYLELATQFWRTYRTTLAAVVGNDQLVAIEQRMLVHLAACMLARVDGKSPVDYLAEDQRERVRRLARSWIVDPPKTWDQAALLSADN